MEELKEICNFRDLVVPVFQWVWDETNGVLASWPFKSYEWPSQNFSLQYQYNITQVSDGNKEKYQLWDYQLIQRQILGTNIFRIIWK